jgi:hypothetical protein
MDRAMWALTIDFWRSRGWQLVGTLLMLMLLPILIYGTIFGIFEFDWQHDPVNVIMHMVLTGIFVLGIVGSLLTWLPSQWRVYTLPITTWKLVITRSMSGALVAAFAYTFVCLLMNQLYQANWPLLGPLLLIVAVYLAAQAVAWLTVRSQALGVLFFAPLCLLCVWWFGLRYESDELIRRSNSQMQMWVHVTWGEGFTLLTIGVVGVWGSFYAASLQRMGSGPTLSGIAAALFRVNFRSGSLVPAHFSTSEKALSWCEWRERGRILPILFACGVLIYGCLLLTLTVDMHHMLEMGGGFSMLGAMSFILLGTYLGHRSERQEFPSFDGTRPITDVQWSNALLRNMTKSTLTACAVWLVGLSLVGAIAWACGGEQLEQALRINLKASFYPYDFSAPIKLVLMAGLWVLACWTFSANGMMLALLRRPASATVVVGGISSFILAIVGINLLIPAVCQEYPEDWQNIAWQVLLGTYSMVVLTVTLGSFIVARRRKMLGHQACWVCLAAWFALVAGFFCWLALPWIIRRGGLVDGDGYLLLVIGGLLMLPLLPIAATPLAVAWNRHR